MLRQHASINQQNFFADQIETVEQLFAAEELNVMQVILPLDIQEKQLAREVEVIGLQVHLLKEYLQIPNPEQHLVGLNAKYQHELTLLEEEFINGYKELLKARDRIFINDQFIEIKPKVAELLNDFRQTLQPEILYYRQFAYTQKSELTLQLRELEKAMNNKIEQTVDLIKRKENLSDRLQQRNIVYGKRQAELKNTFQKQLQQQNDTLPAAAECGDLDKVKKLVSQQTFFNKKSYINQLGIDGYNALHAACANGHLAVVSYLLNQGADPNQPSELGYLAIHFAVAKAHPDLVSIIKLLNKAGTLLEAKGPYNQTPLHTAAFFGNLEAVTFLISQKVNLEAKETNASTGRTALHTAAFKGYDMIVHFLLENGANPFSRNKEGEIPLFEAICGCHQQVVKVFIDKGYCLPKGEIQRLILFAQRTKHEGILHFTAYMLQQNAAQLLVKAHTDPSQDSENKSANQNSNNKDVYSTIPLPSLKEIGYPQSALFNSSGDNNNVSSIPDTSPIITDTTNQLSTQNEDKNPRPV